MRIALVTSGESAVDIFSELHGFLSEKIYNLEVSKSYVPSNLDIPGIVAKLEHFDLVFVSVFFEEMAPSIGLMLEKLVEIEMNSSTKIMKAVEESEIEPGLPDEDLAEAKEELAAKWGNYIIDVLFHPEKIRPGYELPGKTEEDEYGNIAFK